MNDTKPDVLHWHDIQVTALAWWSGPWAHVSWRVSEIIYIDEKTGEPNYTRDGAVDSMDTTTDPEQAEVLIQGSIKWDGCGNFTFDQHAQTHLCGYEDVRRFQAVFDRIYEMTAWYLEKRPGSTTECLPPAKQHPTQLEPVEARP